MLKQNFGWAWSMWAGRPRVGNGAMYKVNLCRNEEVIVKGNFGWMRHSVVIRDLCLKKIGWAWSMWAGRPRIDRIVIREVQYQLEVNRCRNEEVGRPRIDCIVIRIVQYQLEVNRCRNEEIIAKGNFGWVWPIWAGCPRIDRIVIREVQYKLEVDPCRNEEVIVKGNFGWVWPMWVERLSVGNGAMHNEIDRIVIREFQYQFEVNQCRNEEIIVKGNFGWVWSMWAGRPRINCIVIREFQGSSAYSVGGDSGQDGQTDRRWR
ncbi:hypothetical protein DPMN_035878 [Dreissena polymorpha]|uniref:Uncharacterized protein n=1 Tax=Dreissena polymorpha TaxID=45954 RepID=A0A9D4M9Y6_DREPO|nr:hypothetical protein DPMN_035878 [Dreissena polymorpha]